jgi:succinate dehydrogenase/fumarate reductase cytochrome b subunit
MTTPCKLHRAAGAILGVFLAVHVANHLVGLAGVDAYVRFMESARHVYRQPAVEAVLLACVVLQAGSGLRMLQAGRQRRRGLLPWLQAASGAYIALFLAIHVSAVLVARSAGGLDTNFHFAAAGLHVWPYVLFFAPYYFLAVTALFVHLGCALAWRIRAGRMAAVGLASIVGIVAAGAIVAALLGAAVPREYLATFGV